MFFLASTRDVQTIDLAWAILIFKQRLGLGADDVSRSETRSHIYGEATSKISSFMYHRHWFQIDLITSNYNTDLMPTKFRVAIYMFYSCMTCKVEIWVELMWYAPSAHFTLLSRLNIFSRPSIREIFKNKTFGSLTLHWFQWHWWACIEKIVNPKGYVSTLTQHRTLVSCMRRC